VADSLDGPTVSVGQLRQLFDLESDRRVQQLADLGVVVRAAHGRYDLLRSVRGMVKYLRDRSMRSEVSSDDFTAHRARRAKALADREERENAVAASKLIDLDAAAASVGAVVENLTIGVRGMGNKLAPELQGLNVAETAAAIDREGEHILAAFRSAEVIFAGRPVEPGPANPALDGEDQAEGGEPPEDDGEPVGGRLPPTE
jgi:hypothetical protein